MVTDLSVHYLIIKLLYKIRRKFGFVKVFYKEHKKQLMKIIMNNHTTVKNTKYFCSSKNIVNKMEIKLCIEKYLPNIQFDKGLVARIYKGVLQIKHNTNISIKIKKSKDMNSTSPKNNVQEKCAETYEGPESI